MDRLATVAERRSRSRLPNLLTAGLCAYTVAVLLAPKPCYGSQSSGEVSSGMTARGASAISDLDGDQRADLALAEPEWAPAGPNRYRIDIRLTRGPAATFYVDASLSEGLRITARDIDGDDDLDLLVTTRFERLLGVWINDGHGRFSVGMVTPNLQALWQQAAATLETRGVPSSSPVFVCPCSAGFVKPAPAGPWPGFPSSAVWEQTECRAASVRNTGNPLRAPPLQ